MKTFEIKTIDYENKKIAIVFSTSHIPLSKQTENIKNELNKLNFFGDVYFDYLLLNGNTFNRIIKLFFDKEKFSNFQLITLKEVKSLGFKNVFIDFYKENYDKYVKDSQILSDELKSKIKNGIDIF
jgi:hypothetical protein